MEMTMVIRCLLLLVVSCAILTAPVSARPPHRQKRVSDQRLAELETLLALAQMKNRKYVTLPVGYGLIDVQKIGRRKRSMGVVDITGRQEALGPHHPLLQDSSASDYDLGDIIADLSSNLPSRSSSSSSSSSSTDSVKDVPTLLEESYADDDDPALMEDSGRDKSEYYVGGLRPASRPFFLGMRVPPQHQRFY